MPKFLLIDHSLKDLGGHHYPYAYNVLAAAQRAGWEPVLVTHRSFTQHSALPPEWRVHALFHHESYSRYTLDTQATRTAHPSQTTTPGWQRVRNWWSARMRARLGDQFARDCARLFTLEPLAPTDQVFIATTSELDLSGLTKFLGCSGTGLNSDWHLQFHFGIFQGREPDYDLQPGAAASMRSSVIQSLEQSGKQRLHFYCTTEQLTTQYQRLRVATFKTLPYPVHELFRPRAIPGDATAPLRIACLGHSRREKGYAQLPEIVRALWNEWFAPGRAQLVLQTRHRATRRALERLMASLPGGHDSPQVLDFAEFPLPLAEYAKLLCSADVGLMLYDSTRYYARCSGVLLEMLCAGVPVLVPAGGWLAEQIEFENQHYLDQVWSQAPQALPCPESGAIAISDSQQSLLISCRWRPNARPGEYLRLEFALQDATGADQGIAIAILGPRPGELPVRTVLRLPAGCARVRIAMRNAWQRNVAPASDPQWTLLPEAIPMGALGLTVAAGTEVPRLLQDVLEHCSHYHAYVAAHAAGCALAHSGAAVIAGLGAHAGVVIAEPSATT